MFETQAERSNRNSNLQADLAALRAEFKAAGHFEVSTKRLCFDIGLHVTLFSLSYALANVSILLSFAISLVAGINLGWWLHDAGHDSLFKSRSMAKLWTEALSILFFGMSQLDFHYVTHRKHHGQTNVLGRDPAFETGPIIWHESMLGRTKPLLLEVQGYLWIFAVLPLTYLFLSFDGLKAAWKSRHFGRISAVVLRWIIFIFVLKLPLAILLCPMIISAMVGFLACLNHFHLPIMTRASQPQPSHIFFVTQNLSHTSWLFTWLTGGLNFHIEHHLFPEMSSRNYAAIAPRIRELANRYELPYPTCSLPTAVMNFIRKVIRPLNSSAKNLEAS